MREGPSYASASMNARIVCMSFAPMATPATYTVPYCIAIRPRSFLASGFPPAANFATAEREVDFDIWPPVFE